MSDLHDDWLSAILEPAGAGDLSPEDAVIALADRARAQKSVKGPRQFCNVCVRSVPLVYDGVTKDRWRTIQYTAHCPACGARHTVSEKKTP